MVSSEYIYSIGLSRTIDRPTVYTETVANVFRASRVTVVVRCTVCQVTGCRRRLKKQLPINVFSSVVERQPCRQNASSLDLDEPASAAANDVIDRSRALSLSDEIITRFRRPMTPGDTRQNIAFEAVLEEPETNSATIIERF